MTTQHEQEAAAMKQFIANAAADILRRREVNGVALRLTNEDIARDYKASAGEAALIRAAAFDLFESKYPSGEGVRPVDKAVSRNARKRHPQESS